MEETPNICAGPFGALYSFYIERPRLMQVVGRTLWGIDSTMIYRTIEPIAACSPGQTILDVPCGSGVAFRALEPDVPVRYIAADLSPAMLARARRLAASRGLEQVEFVLADMTAMPFEDGAADLSLSISGLHMVPDPQSAINELARCTKPGGRVIGTTFVAGGARRARLAFALGARRGHALPPAREDVERWLEEAGLVECSVGREPGFVAFGGRRAAAGQDS